MNPATEQAYQQIIRQQQARIAELEATGARLTAQVAALTAQVAELTTALARARKNSSNSSKPPSSDITKPPKPPAPGGGKRHPGGQPGHPRHERTPFAPDRIEARTLADRFRRHGRDYFRFVTTPGIEPTNNLAEQAIRFVVQDRHVTQGTRGERGRRWCQRIWTATATCAQQHRSVFDYLHQTLSAHFAKLPTPSLLPAGP
jgi:hypothetical protein